MSAIDLTSSEIKNKILCLISESTDKLTPQSLIRIFTKKPPFVKSQIKSALKELVYDGKIEYTSHYGCTFIEQSFNKPVRISDTIIIAPPCNTCKTDHGLTVVKINRGVSFGSGQHPTTRLSIIGIEYVLSRLSYLKPPMNTSALDIGTGSGILAIVSVVLGINSAIGIDIDPCAIKESKDNVLLNQLGDRIKIYNHDIDKLKTRFSLITANLRCPTIISICPTINKLTERRSAVVISGIKIYEIEKIVDTFSANNFSFFWEKKEKGWASIVFLKNE